MGKYRKPKGKDGQRPIREKMDALQRENLILRIENKDLKKEISALNKRYIEMSEGMNNV